MMGNKVDNVDTSKPTEDNAHRAILAKLIAFSLSLAIVPISLYFVSLRYLWNGNSIYAALTAVFAANVVLGGYIMTSLSEDQQSAKKTNESRKDR